MSTKTFLLDEDLPEFLADEIIRLEPAIEWTQVGMEDSPRKGTKDPEILLFAEANNMILVSMDKRTMPGHLREHFQKGRHTCGVLLLRQGFSTLRYAEELVLVWLTHDDVALSDCTIYIPLQ